jgi:hypothetical protein
LSIERTEIDRTVGYGGLPKEVAYITVNAKTHDKTANYQNLVESRRLNGFPELNRDKQVIEEYLTLPFPDFGIAKYTITIWTQFQTQMNEVLEKIFYSYDYMDSFVCPTDYTNFSEENPKGKSYYFVAFREGLSLTNQSNIIEFSDTERIIKHSYEVKIPYYLILDPKNSFLKYGKENGKPVIYKYQNAPVISLEEKCYSQEEFEKLIKDKK